MQPVKLTGLWIIASIRLLGLGSCAIKPCHLAQVLPQFSGRHSQGSDSLDSTNKACVIMDLAGIPYENKGFLAILIKGFLGIPGKTVGLAQAFIKKIGHMVLFWLQSKLLL